jgi:hypothetical protein
LSKPDVSGVIAAQLADSSTGWSVGTFGAIAEFIRDTDEPVKVERSASRVYAVTNRGGISLTPMPALRLVASEGVTRESWNQRVALCLPREACAMNRRVVLTELGPDTEAIRTSDRGAVLFDLGLDAEQIDACVRVSDLKTVDKLRACCGRAAFAHDNPAMEIILAAQPHRVFISRLGRAEVFSPIPPPDGKSPDGPHTHVLPKLLRHRRTHSATEPIPDGFVPCAHFYPAHPSKDAIGVPKPYDSLRHRAFQELMRTFGDGASIALKAQAMAAISADRQPSVIAVPNDRFARAAIRIGVRQLLAAGEQSPALAAWRDAHDRQHRDDLDDGDAGAMEH